MIGYTLAYMSHIVHHDVKKLFSMLYYSNITYIIVSLSFHICQHYIYLYYLLNQCLTTIV